MCIKINLVTFIRKDIFIVLHFNNLMSTLTILLILNKPIIYLFSAYDAIIYIYNYKYANNLI